MPDALPNLDLGSLVNQATKGGADTSWVDTLTKKMTGIQQKEEAETAPIRESVKRDYEKGKQVVDEKFDALKPVDVEPWKEKPPETDPYQAFGSAASVFGILASAFTHAPMENAINAAASAINATRNNDAVAYKTAYDAWQKNTRLALERHQAQHEDYTAALEKMKTDMDGGTALLKTLATKYGDERTTLLAEAGLHEWMGQMMNARQNSALRILEVFPQLERAGNARQDAYDLADARKSGDPAKIAEVEQRIRDREEALTGKSQQPTMGEQESKAVDELVAKGASRADAVKQVMQSYRLGGSAISTMRADAVTSQIKEQEAAKGRPLTGTEKANVIANVYKGGLTGNAQEKLQTRVDQFDDSMDKLDDTLKVLDGYVGAAGVAGKVTRSAERVRDIFGSNDTDRVQFMRNIEYLQLMASRLLTDAQGRPLSKDAEKITDIVGGLNLGDTTANTMRSLEEVQKLYNGMRKDTLAKLKGDWKPRNERDPAPSSGGSSPSPTAPNPTPWANDPVVQ